MKTFEQLENKVLTAGCAFMIPEGLDGHVKDANYPQDSLRVINNCEDRRGLTVDFGDGQPFQQRYHDGDLNGNTIFFGWEKPGDYTIKLINDDGIVEDALDVVIKDWQVPGDINYDYRFDSGDLVKMFAAGKYETDERANRWQGDLNFDGVFDSSDLVLAMNEGDYKG